MIEKLNKGYKKLLKGVYLPTVCQLILLLHIILILKRMIMN